VQHVSTLGLINKTDREIWIAVIWIRTGNTSSINLERILTDKIYKIEQFHNDPTLVCLEFNDP
jgi:predicted nuclease of predicted toxin-antitoxin system